MLQNASRVIGRGSKVLQNLFSGAPKIAPNHNFAVASMCSCILWEGFELGRKLTASSSTSARGFCIVPCLVTVPVVYFNWYQINSSRRLFTGTFMLICREIGLNSYFVKKWGRKVWFVTSVNKIFSEGADWLASLLHVVPELLVPTFCIRGFYTYRIC